MRWKYPLNYFLAAIIICGLCHAEIKEQPVHKKAKGGNQLWNKYPEHSEWLLKWMGHMKQVPRVLKLVSKWANHSDNYQHFAHLLPGPNLMSLLPLPVKKLKSLIEICDDSPCFDGSTCLQFGSVQYCRCAVGYKGRFCDIKYAVEECVYTPPSDYKCVFPFTYNGKDHNNCTSGDGPSSMFCSLTNNYDIDKRGIACNQTCKDILPCGDYLCTEYCPYGYRVNTDDGCPMCDCADNPCKTEQGLKCETGEICTVKRNRAIPGCKHSKLGPCPSQYIPTCVKNNKTASCPKKKDCDKTCNSGFVMKQNGCQSCRCAAPCKPLQKLCPPDSQCVVEFADCLDPDKCVYQNTTGVGVCRPVNKPGKCPKLKHYSPTKTSWGRRKWKQAECKFQCYRDISCPGLSKCCRNGCGMACTGDLIDDTDRPCTLKRAAAIISVTENDPFLYFPKCDDNGMFQTKQCVEYISKSLSNRTDLIPADLLPPNGEVECVCVDQKTGTQIPNTKFIGATNKTCEEIVKDAIQVTCKEQKCVKNCYYGFVRDENGCKTCQCKSDPCKTKICDAHTTCKILSINRTCNENKEGKTCEHFLEPVCEVDISKMRCPGTKKTINFINYVTHTTTSCKSRGRNNCHSQTEYCYMPDKNKEYGICCQRKTSAFLPGYRSLTDTICLAELRFGSTNNISSTDCAGKCNNLSLCVGISYEGGTSCKLCKHFQRSKYHWKRLYNYEKVKVGECPKSKLMVKHLLGMATCKSKCMLDGDCPDRQKCCKTKCGANVCVQPQGTPDSACVIKRRTAYALKKLMPNSITFLPRCNGDGTWETIQCHDYFGMCWCVSAQGKIIKGTAVRGVPNCETGAPVQDNIKKVCPNSEKVKHCDPALCDKSHCARSDSVCRVNPCGSCTAQFYDANNTLVDCIAGMGSCEVAKMTAEDTSTNRFMLNTLTPVQKNKLPSDADKWSYQFPGLLKRVYLQNSIQYSAILESSGLCPLSKFYTAIYSQRERCAEICLKDGDCQDGQVCCSTGCGTSCWEPVLQEKRCLSSKPDNNCNNNNKMMMMMSSMTMSSNIKQSKYYYNKDTLKCEDIKVCDSIRYYGFSLVDERNLFDSIEACWKTCAEVHPLVDPVVPQCDKSGKFESKQCHGGLCWCAKPDTGIPVPETLTKGRLQCDINGNIVKGSSPQLVCPGDEPVEIPDICSVACSTTACYPTTNSIKLMITNGAAKKSDWWTNWSRYKTDIQCQANPCGNCSVKFFINENQEFECADISPCDMPKSPGHCKASTTQSTRWYFDAADHICKPFSFGGCGGNLNNFMTRVMCSSVCGGAICPEGKEPQICEDKCDDMSCDGFPGALCTSDPCTCETIFIDPESGSTVNCAKEQTLCERMRADSDMKRLMSPLHASDIDIVECEGDGSFNPQQCSYKHKLCWCVNDWGDMTPGSKVVFDDSFESRKTVHACGLQMTKAVDISFMFPREFRLISPHIDEFKRILQTEIAKQLKTTPDHIIKLKVQEGSIVVHFTVTPEKYKDLASSVDLFNIKILNGKFSIMFQGEFFTASPMNVTFKAVEEEEIKTVELKDTPVQDEKNSDNNTAVIASSTVLSIGCVILGCYLAVKIIQKKCQRNLSEDKVRFHNEPDTDPVNFSYPTQGTKTIEGVSDSNSKV